MKRSALIGFISVVLALTGSAVLAAESIDDAWLRLIETSFPSCAVTRTKTDSAVAEKNGYRAERWSVQTCHGDFEYQVAYYPPSAFPDRASPYEVIRIAASHAQPAAEYHPGSPAPSPASVAEAPHGAAAEAAAHEHMKESLPPSPSAPAEAAETPPPPPPAPAEAAPAPAPPSDGGAGASPFAGVDQFIAAMPAANIAFNVPEQLNLKQTGHIQLLLDVKKSQAALAAEIAEAGVKQTATVKVWDRMEARLTAPQLQITAITPEEQSVGSADTAEWRWDVLPTATGQYPLHLTLTALIETDGATSRIPIHTYDKTIAVKVTAGQWAAGFFENNWQWLWAAILLPVVGLVWKRWKRNADVPGGHT